MPIEMVEVPICNICKTGKASHFLEREDLNLFLPGQFRLVRCENCGLIYLNPRPASSSYNGIYPAAYDQFESFPDKQNKSGRMLKYGFQKRINAIEKYVKGGLLCDIGCATGDFLYELSLRTNWKGLGIEPSPEASEIARSRGINIIQNRIEEIATIGESQFDVVTMWNVIEHLEDPQGALEKIAQWMIPNGLLVITTPNFESLDRLFFGRYWIGYELPRHYYVFSTETLSLLLSKAGFQLVGQKCLFGTHASIMSSFKFMLRGVTHLRWSSIDKITLSPPSRVILSPIFYILDRLSLSTSMTYFARRIL